jgi:hypothetical protein
MTGATTAADPDPLAQWPESWANAYRRFEGYIAAREKYIPSGTLQISPKGSVVYPQDMTPLSAAGIWLHFYHDGNIVWEDLHMLDLFGNDRARRLPPGKYAVRSGFASWSGLPQLYPLNWIETYREEPGNAPKADSGDASPPNLSVRIIPAPEPAEDYWPNERLLKFIDFTHFAVMGRGVAAGDEIRTKLTPSLTFTLSPTGVLTRDPLDAPLEKLLHWRIYHDGRLIERGPAANVTRFAIASGPGVYQVFAGVEGPAGFMPVSRPLQFPLFPEKNGGLAVMPSMTNPNGFPDFLVDLLPPATMKELMEVQVSKNTGPGYYNVHSYYLTPPDPAPGSDPKKDSLRWLWIAWAWDLNAAHDKGALPPSGGERGF